MARILRGDIVWADLGSTVGSEQSGIRPVAVLSNDIFNERSGTVITMPLTSREPEAHFWMMIEVTSAILPRRSWVKVGQVRTISTSRLGKTLGRLSPAELRHILQGLGKILGSGRNG